MRPALMALALGLAGCARLVGIKDLQGADGGGDGSWNATDSLADARAKDAIDLGRVDAPLDMALDTSTRGGDALPDGSSTTDAAFDVSRDSGVDMGIDAPACPPLVWHEATASLYRPSGVGACSYAAETLPTFIAGIDDEGFDQARGCGMCLRVVAGDPAKATKSIDVLVVEHVAGGTGQGRQIGLGRAAMDAVASPDTSFTVLSFAVVPCAPSLIHDTVRIAPKQGSSLQHLEIMIRDSRAPVTKVELKHGGVWKPMTLTSYNYWLIEQPGEDRIYDLQLTAGDERLQVNQITLTSNSTQDGPLVDTGLQFSTCSGL